MTDVGRVGEVMGWVRTLIMGVAGRTDGLAGWTGTFGLQSLFRGNEDGVAISTDSFASMESESL